MGERRKGREFALQALYLIDIAKIPNEIAIRGVTHLQKMEEKTRGFTRRLVEGTFEHSDELDKIIIKYSENWELNRMAALDRNILRLGAFELLHEKDTPVSVIIDEAVEIAKTYSTPDSGKFVNGLLDKIKTERKESKKKSNGKPGVSKS